MVPAGIVAIPVPPGYDGGMRTITAVLVILICSGCTVVSAMFYRDTGLCPKEIVVSSGTETDVQVSLVFDLNGNACERGRDD